MTPQSHARAEHCSARDPRRLLGRCSAGDACAREIIILRFLPLARRIARTYEGRGEPLEDLFQVASVGLIKAVDAYSPARGNAFAAYARPMIHGEIRRHFRDATWRVHVPRPVKERAARVFLAELDLTGASGSAEPAAIADHLGISPEEVAEARGALEAQSPRSLDAGYANGNGDELPLNAVIGAEEPEYERAELSVGIRAALRTFKPRDQKVLLLRLVCELSQDDIASRVGLSQMHVSRILRKAGVALIATCGMNVSALGRSPGSSRAMMGVIGKGGFKPSVYRA